ncbi:MAG: hypothetical protein ACE5HD_04125 [Acidobacteriota bacterium]
MVLLVLAGAPLLGPAPQAQDKPEEVAEPGTSAPGEQRDLDFTAAVTTLFSHREDARLTQGSGSLETERVRLALGWTLDNSRTTLFASLSPYYERFQEQTSLSTYGGSAGLGLTHQVSPRQILGVTGTVVAAPEQDVPTPQTSSGPALPQAGILVPRNGFVRATLRLGDQIELSSRSHLDVAVSGGLIRFNAFDAGENTSNLALADQSSYQISAGYLRRASPRRGWMLDFAGNRTSVDENGQNLNQGQKNRDQIAASFGSTFDLVPRSELILRGGVSSIETRDGGSATTPSFSMEWVVAAERVSGGLVLSRGQGVFSGSTTSVTTTSGAGNMAWQAWRRTSLQLGAGYSVSSAAEEQAGGNGDIRSRTVSASVSQARRTLSWSVSASQARQRSDANFGRNLQTATVSVSFSWRFAGGRT